MALGRFGIMRDFSMTDATELLRGRKLDCVVNKSVTNDVCKLTSGGGTWSFSCSTLPFR